MNENDTSDEAAFEWISKIAESYEGFSMDAMRGWQECRRRCDNMILEWTGKQLILVEERERKAFEAGANACQVAIIQGSQGRETKTLDEAYRAFKEAQK